MFVYCNMMYECKRCITLGGAGSGSGETLFKLQSLIVHINTKGTTAFVFTQTSEQTRNQYSKYVR